jgi:hypothetical protein
MNNITLLRIQLENTKKTNQILLNAKSGVSISAKTVGILVEDMLSILQTMIEELEEVKIRQKEDNHE